jgi:chaperonin GroES
MIKPLADRVVLEREPEKTITDSGIFIPTATIERESIAIVRAIGAEVKELELEDKVIYKDYSTTQVKVDGTEYLIIKEEDIIAIVEEK